MPKMSDELPQRFFSLEKTKAPERQGGPLQPRMLKMSEELPSRLVSLEKTEGPERQGGLLAA